MARKDEYGQIGKPRIDSSSELQLNGIRKMSGRTRSSRAVLRLIFSGIIVLALVAALAITSGVMNNKRAADSLQQISEANYNPSFKVRYDDLGERIIRNWYSGGIQPVPMGAGLTWTGDPATNIGGFGDQESASAASGGDSIDQKDIPKVTDVAFYSGDRHDAKFLSDGTTEGHIESLTYLIVMNGKQYLSSITLNILQDDSSPDSEKPVLTSVPTLTPYIIFMAEPNNDISNEPVDLEEVKEKPNESTMTAIQSFADAWAKNDSVRIKQIVQDSNADNIYYGLGSGWSLSSTSGVEVNWQRVGLVGTDRYTIMNVSFPITSKGEAPIDKETGLPDESKQPIYNVTQSLDIVVDDYNSSLPAILAWGPSGSWPTLDPYSNAVDAKELKLSETDMSSVEEESTEGTEESEQPSDEASESPEPTKSEKKKEEK